ncbi:HAD family hydrolase [Streptomyces sp. NPDC008313]|uniref:HAD family hydrolase n=1 Tax=Streptomyces sp. NPDC008313 TaxID=3364826 RepID=UPI0036E15B2D
MTPDTKQTELAAEETEKLRELISPVRHVLFDFDGPICRLFAGHKAERVARDLVDWLERQGLSGLLTEQERLQADPMVVLYAVNRRHPRSDLVAELEQRLTQQELKAASSAMPTAFADPLVRTWCALGARLAVASNNAPTTVTRYLASRGLTECFAPHVYGRSTDLDLLKPNPYCLNRALNAMGAAARDALMIGDAPSDYAAAVSAGVPFLGFARNERKEKLLRDAGVRVTVASMEPVLRLLRQRV